jgi:hypothetical protein
VQAATASIRIFLNVYLPLDAAVRGTLLRERHVVKPSPGGQDDKPTPTTGATSLRGERWPLSGAVGTTR